MVKDGTNNNHGESGGNKRAIGFVSKKTVFV